MNKENLCNRSVKIYEITMSKEYAPAILNSQYMYAYI